MARTNDPDSATAQFFINVANNDFLNHKNETPSGYGYAVFGKVIQGPVSYTHLIPSCCLIKNVKKSDGLISTRGIPRPEQLPKPASKDKIPCIIWKRTINAEKRRTGSFPRHIPISD